MTKKDNSKAITKVNPNLPTTVAVPDFMDGETVTGLDALKQFVVPPFIKIIQKQAADELLQSFGAGDVILSPANAMIVEMPRDIKGHRLEDSRCAFKIVPVLCYPEWLTWNPIELKGTEQSIRYRTTDPNDPVVSKARAPSLRSEPHPTRPELMIRHVEHINFLVILYDHPLGMEPAILSFSRGEWKSGSKFAALVKMRKAPIYGGVYDAVVTHRKNDKGDWFGFNMCNPEDGNPWVKKEEYKAFKAIHEEFAKLHAESKLRAAYEPISQNQDEASTKPTAEF